METYDQPSISHAEVSRTHDEWKNRELPPRVREYFDARERQAVALVRFFRAMEEVPVSSVPRRWDEVGILGPSDAAQYERYLATCVQGLSPEAQEACMFAWDRWSVRTRSLDRQLRDIAKEFKMDDWRKDSPDALGRKIFYVNTNLWPEGTVRAVVKGPYLMIAFEQKGDWNRYNTLSIPYAKEGQEEAGYHATDAILNRKTGNRAPTMGFPSLEVDPSYLKHEIQHFLNHCLATDRSKAPIEKWESERDRTYSALDQQQRELKDEILAYLRDGRTPYEMDASLLGPSYRRLFENSNRRHLEKLLGLIVNALNDHPLIRFPSTSEHLHARELLVASLLDVPLHKMEHYLKLSAKYYRERLSGKYGAANHGLLEDHVRQMPRRERYFVDNAE